MPEEQIKEPVVASLGKPERIQTQKIEQPVEKQVANTDNSNANNGNVADQEKGGTEDAVNKIPELNDEQLKEILKGKGIDFESFDTLKEKLTVPAAELTEEQKIKQEADFDKRRLDLFLANGGTIESYAAVKSVLAMDLTELSKTELKKELKDSGFTEDEIEVVLKERYYQINPDELEQELGEEDDDFEKRKAALKKKNEYGSKKLQNRGTYIKKNAEGVFKNLETALKQSDLSKREMEEAEKKLLSKTDEIFSKLPTKITFELGKGTDGAELAPVQYDVDDADMQEVKTFLKDPAQRNNFLYTAEGELNVESIVAMKVENANLKKALKVAYLEGGSRQVEAFKKVFPHHSPQSVGLNGNAQQQNLSGQKGQPVSFGKPQRVPTGR